MCRYREEGEGDEGEGEEEGRDGERRGLLRLVDRGGSPNEIDNGAFFLSYLLWIDFILFLAGFRSIYLIYMYFLL